MPNFFAAERVDILSESFNSASIASRPFFAGPTLAVSLLTDPLSLIRLSRAEHVGN